MLDSLDETIESVTKKDGRITAISYFDDKTVENINNDGLTYSRFEYVLDAKTHDIVSMSGDYAYDDGSAYSIRSEMNYDADAPEAINAFLEFDNQKENLRNVTVVTNPGTEQEISETIQAPKGMYIEFISNYDVAELCELYADEACTEPYDFYENPDSDLTIYVKWSE